MCQRRFVLEIPQEGLWPRDTIGRVTDQMSDNPWVPTFYHCIPKWCLKTVCVCVWLCFSQDRLDLCFETISSFQWPNTIKVNFAHNISSEGCYWTLFPTQGPRLMEVPSFWSCFISILQSLCAPHRETESQMAVCWFLCFIPEIPCHACL